MTGPLDPLDFITFSDLAKGFPSLKPRNTRAWLESQYLDALLTDAEHLTLGTVRVSRLELAEVFQEINTGGFCSHRVSPQGARLLKRLYQAKALDTGTNPIGPLSAEVEAYCVSEPELLKKAQARAELARQRNAEKDALEARLLHPESFEENEFTYSLLNAIFFANRGAGSARMIIGGIEIQKELTPFGSNSGKSRDFRVDFAWRSPTGESRRLTKPSTFERNRRNDEQRNWGLPQ